IVPDAIGSADESAGGIDAEDDGGHAGLVAEMGDGAVDEVGAGIVDEVLNGQDDDAMGRVAMGIGIGGFDHLGAFGGDQSQGIEHGAEDNKGDEAEDKHHRQAKEPGPETAPPAPAPRGWSVVAAGERRRRRRVTAYSNRWPAGGRRGWSADIG